MRFVKQMSAALMTAVALSAVVSSAASAESPEILPVPTEKAPLKYTGEGGASRTEATKGQILECEKGKGSGSFTSQNAGLASGTVEGCKASGVNCNTAGDAPGIILTNNEQVTLVDYKNGSELLLGIVGTLKEAIKIKCGVGLTIEVRGSGMAKVDNVASLVKTKTATVLGHQKKGEQELKTCELPKAFCEGKTFSPEINFGKGFELVGGEGEGKVTFEKEAEVHF